MNRLVRRSNVLRPDAWQRRLWISLLLFGATLVGLVRATQAQAPPELSGDGHTVLPAVASENSPPAASTVPDPHALPRQTLVVSITIFALAVFVGVELISKVPATLHTPLMSGSNAISGITVVGALIAAGQMQGVGPLLGFLAVVLAMINVVGGFLVTQRMLQMFKRR
jgi:NAD(P) transhydrogenase subunit alpha